MVQHEQVLITKVRQRTERGKQHRLVPVVAIVIAVERHGCLEPTNRLMALTIGVFALKSAS